MSQTLEDLVFGKITFNSEENCWQGTALLGFTDKVLALDIVGNSESGPTAEQRASYVTFIQNSDIVKADLQQAFYQYYSALRESLLHTMPEEAAYFERDMPFLHEPEHIWNLVTPTTLLIQNQDALQGDNIALQWECSWDIEHGLLAVYRDQQLVEVCI